MPQYNIHNGEMSARDSFKLPNQLITDTKIKKSKANTNILLNRKPPAPHAHRKRNYANINSRNSKCSPYSLVTATNLTFKEAFARHAGYDRIIILSYVDMGFIDMAQNFIETSLSKHNITNVLFFSSSTKACEFLEEHMCRACFISQAHDESEQESAFGSLEFISKMNSRTHVIHNALMEGYHVVHTDNDVVFLQNPLDDIKEKCDADCDVAPLWDSRSHNAGFIFIKATGNSKRLYARMIEIAEAFPEIDDQNILNAAIDGLS